MAMTVTPSPREIFGRVSGSIHAQKLRGLDVTYQFLITGQSGGEWALVIRGGEARVVDGKVPGATATIIMSDIDFVDLTTGRVSGMKAFMGGKIKIRGSIRQVMRLGEMFASR